MVKANAKKHSERAAANTPTPQTPATRSPASKFPRRSITRISELMVPGSSLIVSDQGFGDKTGEGTDFVVVSR